MNGPSWNKSSLVVEVRPLAKRDRARQPARSAHPDDVTLVRKQRQPNIDNSDTCIGCTPLSRMGVDDHMQKIPLRPCPAYLADVKQRIPDFNQWTCQTDRCAISVQFSCCSVFLTDEDVFCRAPNTMKGCPAQAEVSIFSYLISLTVGFLPAFR